jgi:beta-lactamase regulating signal transducer with metallopeptidase domain
MIVSGLQPLAQLFAERLVNAAVAGLVVAGMVWLALRYLGRQNSGTRFAIWFSTLLAIVAFPFFSGSLLGSSRLHPAFSGNAHGEIVLAASWARYLLAAWSVVAAVLLFRLGLGLWRMRQLRKSFSELDPAGLDPELAKVFQTSALRRQVRLCVSDEVAVPAAVGLFRPAIVFPAWLLHQLAPAEIEMILRHELAHFRRWDDWTNLAQKIVKALFVFHPAVWWIESRLTLEREMACDDMVLAQTGSPRAYASSLISFAEKLHNARGLALAQALVSRMHQMSLRVAQILDAKRPRETGLWKPVFGLSAGLLALVLGAAPYMPRLVAFESPSNQPRLEASAKVKSLEGKRGQPEVVRAAVDRMIARPVRQGQNVGVRQPQAIAATFHPRTKAMPSLRAEIPQKPLIMRPSVASEQPPVQTIFILRSTSYDAAGGSSPAIWTLCIWKVDGKNPAGGHLESAIVISWI